MKMAVTHPGTSGSAKKLRQTQASARGNEAQRQWDTGRKTLLTVKVNKTSNHLPRNVVGLPFLEITETWKLTGPWRSAGAAPSLYR